MPTKTQGERLAVIEERLEQNERDHSVLQKEVLEIKTLLKEFTEAAPAQFASKTVEKIVYGMVGIIIVAVLYALIEQVIEK